MSNTTIDDEANSRSTTDSGSMRTIAKKLTSSTSLNVSLPLSGEIRHRRGIVDGPQ